MILQDIYDNINLKLLIEQNYNGKYGDEHNLSNNELNIIENILLSRISFYLELDILNSEQETINIITKFIKRNVLSIVWDIRSIIQGINNNNITATHTQNRFTPIDNTEDINKQPIFSDSVSYNDLQNYLSKNDFMKDKRMLSLWISVNRELVKLF